MAVPKRKSSKMRCRARKASHRVPLADTQKCPQCGAQRRTHRVCPSCGYYRGRQILTVEAD